MQSSVQFIETDKQLLTYLFKTYLKHMISYISWQQDSPFKKEIKKGKFRENLIADEVKNSTTFLHVS